jgi:quercetin dioxygenase-like cupin family protein/DNA-binding Xre family transcriptional regulator
LKGRFPPGQKQRVKVSEAKRNLAMESNTVAEGLGKYGIGQKLRRLRLRKSMGLEELSRHTGLSPALLSKLERGLMHPTLPTLLRISMVFSVGLEHFFNPEPKPVVEVVRKADRLRFPDSPQGEPNFHFESLDFRAEDRKFSGYYAEFEASTQPRSHQHPGVELVYVIAGRLTLTIGEQEYELSEGDSIYFDSTVQHS